MEANRGAARVPGRTPQPPAPLARVGSSSVPSKPRRSMPSPRESAASSESHRPPNNNGVASEPATEDDDGDEATDASLDAMHKQLTQLLADVTNKHQKNRQRKTAGKDEQIARLRATYGDLSVQLAELESLCDSSGDTDAETLDKLFRNIPRHEQLQASGD